MTVIISNNIFLSYKVFQIGFQKFWSFKTKGRAEGSGGQFTIRTTEIFFLL